MDVFFYNLGFNVFNSGGVELVTSQNTHMPSDLAIVGGVFMDISDFKAPKRTVKRNDFQALSW